MIKQQTQILIVEDELLIAEMLKQMIESFDPRYKVIGTLKNIASIQSHLDSPSEIDLVFLDIHLGQKDDGLLIAEILSERGIPFIFVTSYSDKHSIAEAAKFQPEAYICKPFSEGTIYPCLEVFNSKRQNDRKSLLIKEGNKMKRLMIEDVLFVKSDNIYLFIYTHEKRFVIRKSMEQLVSQLHLLTRTHRSYAVNLDRVEVLERDILHIGDWEIPISRKYKKEVFDLLRDDILS